MAGVPSISEIVRDIRRDIQQRGIISEQELQAEHFGHVAQLMDAITVVTGKTNKRGQAERLDPDVEMVIDRRDGSPTIGQRLLIKREEPVTPDEITVVTGRIGTSGEDGKDFFYSKKRERVRNVK